MFKLIFSRFQQRSSTFSQEKNCAMSSAISRVQQNHHLMLFRTDYLE